MLPTETSDALQAGTWSLESTEVFLERQDGKRCFVGSGTVSRDADGQIQFVLHGRAGQDEARCMLESDGVQAGEFIPDSQRYVFTLIDKHGEKWTAKLYASFTVTTAARGSVVKGRLQEIERIRDTSDTAAFFRKRKPEVKCIHKKTLVKLTCFRPMREFPCNRNLDRWVRIDDREIRNSSARAVAKFDSPLYRFEFIREREKTTFSLTSRRTRRYYDGMLHHRLIETLQFVFGQPLVWDVLEIAYWNTEETRVRCCPGFSENARLRPPVKLRLFENFDSVWGLFRSYFSHIGDFAGPGWHPISRRLYVLQHAHGTVWPITCLVTAVQLEWIMRHYYHPGNAKGTKSFKAENKLKELETLGLATEAERLAWRRLRHDAAHAESLSVEITNERAFDIAKTYVAFYKLVFQLIGYNGLHTNYGIPGHPENQFTCKAGCQ